MNFDDLRTITHDNKTVAYDIFRSGDDVYMICPYFYHEFDDYDPGSSKDYRIRIIKNSPPMQMSEALISIWLDGVKGDIHSCPDVCTLVRFANVQGGELSLCILGENVHHSFILPENPHKKVKIACATIMLNEDAALDDWLYWHSGIGVDGFLLYDNGSDSVEQLKTIASNYNSIFIDWPFPMFFNTPHDWKYGYAGNGTLYFASQGAQQTHSIYKYRDNTEWICNIDVDEFIMPYRSIYELNKYEDYSFVMLENVLYNATKNTGEGRVYERHIYREDLENLIGPNRLKIISNSEKLMFGDYLAIHFMWSNGRRAVLNRFAEMRMNHYRGATRKSHKANVYDDLLNIKDEIMIEISNNFVV